MKDRSQSILIYRLCDSMYKTPLYFHQKKILKLINKFIKVTGYVNIQKSIAFLYTAEEHTEKEVREIIPFIVTQRNTLK